MNINFDLLEIIIISLLGSCLITAISLPNIKNFGEKYQIRDKLSLRKQKNESLVRIGGIGIFLGFFSTVIFIKFATDFGTYPFFNYSFFVPFFISITGIFLLGLLDDIFSLSPLIRLLCQIFISIYLYSSGLNIERLGVSWLNFEPVLLPTFISILITTIWLVGVTNAINWTDGLDGLTSGIISIAGVSLIIITYSKGQILVPIVTACLIGSSLGFLKYNFYPAKIIMGDGGSYFLGFTFASLSLLSVTSSSNPISILIPIFLLLIPITDMCIVITKRLIKGKSPFFPDRRHLHHKLIDMGFSELRTVISIYGFSLFISTNVTILALPKSISYLPLSLISGLLFLICLIVGKINS